MKCVAIVPYPPPLEIARQKERHYMGRLQEDTFISVIVETCGEHFSQNDGYLRYSTQWAYH